MNIEIVTGESKKTGNTYEAVKVTIGDWSSLVFPRSKFEMNYIKDYINNHGE